MRQLEGGSNTNHVQNLELCAIDINHFEQINSQGVIEPRIPWQLGLVCWLFLRRCSIRSSCTKAGNAVDSKSVIVKS